MEQFEGITNWISANVGYIVTIGGVILEIVFRLIKSDKIRSIFSYAGRILTGIGKLSFAIADILSKIVPDRRLEETPK